jgi:hypothetical protein
MSGNPGASGRPDIRSFFTSASKRPRDEAEFNENLMPNSKKPSNTRSPKREPLYELQPDPTYIMPFSDENKDCSSVAQKSPQLSSLKSSVRSRSSSPKLALNASQDTVSRNSDDAMKNHKSKKQKKSSSFMKSSVRSRSSSPPKLELNGKDKIQN